jgi:membrane-bound metal-dependent hydrolase YbcI (DUF457 family)
MKTPTHGLLGYAVARAAGWTGKKRRCAIIGAVIPDMPVILAGAYSVVLTVLEKSGFDFAYFKMQMDQLYFANSALLFSHNFFHSSLNLALLACIALYFLDSRSRPAALAFLAGAASHSVADIFSHIDDGPLLFWPLNSQIRFTGVISHWESGRGGLLMTLIECSAFLGAFIMTCVKWSTLRPSRKQIGGSLAILLQGAGRRARLKQKTIKTDPRHRQAA